MFHIWFSWTESVSEVFVEAFTKEAAQRTWDALNEAGAVMRSTRP
jgi:hypothetical protein